MHWRFLIPFCPEFLNDIYEFDVDDLSWTNVTSTAAGPAPPGRALHGFCGSPNLGLYVFGGKASQTGILSPSFDTVARDATLVRIGELVTVMASK